MQSDIDEAAGWLARLARDVLPRDPIEVDAPFLDCQQSTDAGARLAAEITRRRNLALPKNIVDRYRSPRLLAEWMCRNGNQIYEPVIRFRAREPWPEPSDMLFCVHPVSGVGTVFKKLAERLAPRFLTSAFNARGLNPGETPFDSFGEMVTRYADRVAEISSGKPPHLLGWSFGGQIAQAIALELQRRGHPTGSLVLVDSWIFHDATAEKPAPLPTFDEYVREKYALFLPDQVTAFETMDERIRPLVEKLIELDAFSERARELPRTATKRLLNVAFRLDAMFRRHRPPPYPGRALLVRASDNESWGYDVAAQWKPIVGDLSIERLPYPHLAMFAYEDSVEAIAALVRRHCTESGGKEAPLPD